jgi:hypothetical protein
MTVADICSDFVALLAEAKSPRRIAELADALAADAARYQMYPWDDVIGPEIPALRRAVNRFLRWHSKRYPLWPPVGGHKVPPPTAKQYASLSDATRRVAEAPETDAEYRAALEALRKLAEAIYRFHDMHYDARPAFAAMYEAIAAAMA